MNLLATVWVPASFEPQLVLPARYWKHRESVFVLIHRLKMTDVTRGEPTYVDISHRTGRKMFSRDSWEPVRDSLLDRGILECDGRYIPTSKGFGYRLAASLASDDLIDRELRSDRAIRHLAQFAPAISCVGLMRDYHEYLLSCLYRMTIDMALLERHLLGSSTERKHLAHTGAMLINRGHHRFAVDAYHRVHTLPTSIPRESRSAILLDGFKTIERDVSCSQPLFLGAITRNYMIKRSCNAELREREEKQEGRQGPPVDGEVSSYSQYDGGSCTHIQTNTYIDYSSYVAQLPRDFDHYIFICENASHYPEFADVVGMPYKTPEDKQGVKTEWCCLVFGYNSHDLWLDHWERFAAWSPTIAAMVERLRVPSYKNVAHTLQRVEADVMIAQVCGSLMAMGAPIATIHDSIRSTHEFESHVNQAILDGYATYNVVPNIK